jgi:uncharacterized protein YndB with AHSA1/START domain
MSKNEITIEIDSPVEDVFSFTIDPTNTPKWLKSIAAESRSDELTSVGTIYTNISDSEQQETSYRVTAYEVNRLFQLQRIGEDYHCTYVYEPIDNGKRTMLTYIEEVGVGMTLESPLKPEVFNTLKSILESRHEN